MATELESVSDMSQQKLLAQTDLFVREIDMIVWGSAGYHISLLIEKILFNDFQIEFNQDQEACKPMRERGRRKVRRAPFCPAGFSSL